MRHVWLVMAVVNLIGVPLPAVADDWPQWLGSQRDSIYREQGIQQQMPADGLRILWRTPVSSGYAGPAVAKGRVFVMDYVTTKGESTNSPDGRDDLNGMERVLAVDADSGKRLWTFEYERPYHLSYPNGPRATPTVDGNCVYTLGAEGDLHCLRVDTGDVLWRKQLAKEYPSETPIWGHAAHPLVYGDLLICLAGGAGSVVVAINKLTGEEVWRALSASEIGYCPPTIQVLGGKERLLIWDADALHALEPLTGEVVWDYPLKPRYGMSIAAPRLSGKLLYACGIGEVAAMIELDDAGKPSRTLWKGKPQMGLYCGNSTPIFDGGVIYGADCGTGEFIAVEAQTGKQTWTTFALTTGGERRASHGTAFVVKHEQRYLLFTETGDLVFAQLSPQGFTEQGRMHVLEPTGDCFGRPVVWSHPAFANRCMFARNDKELVCVSLAEGQ